jgi:Ca2+-binding RTX toxin-like protein
VGGTVVGTVRGHDGNDTLLGGAGAETFVGGINNDILNGGGGADSLDGEAGNDTYQLGADITDTLNDAAGIDTVTSTITRTLTWGFIDNLILQGAGNINGTGNALTNGIVGNNGNNILAGQGGTDTLFGGGGNDFLFGQLGKDNLRGDAGDDRFVYQSVNDSQAGAAMRDIILDLDDSGEDAIDMTAIPGLTGASFIGNVAFTGINQVRVQQVGPDVLVQVNTAGDTTPEAEMLLANTTIGAGAGQVNGTDFLL